MEYPSETMATNPHAIPKIPDGKATYSNQISQGVVKSRTHIRFPPKYSDSFKAGDTLRIEIPSTGWLDPQTLVFSGQVRILNFTAQSQKLDTPTAPDYRGLKACLKNHGVQGLFNRVKLIFGSTVVEDIQEAHNLINLVFNSTSDNSYRRNVHFNSEGVRELHDDTVYSSADPNMRVHDLTQELSAMTGYGPTTYPPAGVTEYFNGPYRDFTWTLNLCGLLAAEKYIPLRYMGSLIVELYLAPNPEVIYSLARKWTDGSGVEHIIHHDKTSYELVNVNAEAEMCTFDESFEKAAMATIQNEGLKINFQTWNHHARNIRGVASTDLQISERAGSVRGILFAFRNIGDENARYLEPQFHAHRLEEYQVRIGQEMFPSQPIQLRSHGTLAHLELRRFWGQVNTITSTGVIHSQGYYYYDPRDTAVTKAKLPSAISHHMAMPHQFIGAMSFLRSPGQLSGYNSIASNADIEIKLKFISGSTDLEQSQYTQTAQDTQVYIQGDWVNSTNQYPDFTATSMRVLCWTYLDCVLNITGIGNVSVSK
jgi:hypothetical protein